MNTKYAHYIRKTLKNAEDLDAAVEKLFIHNTGNIAEAQIIDMYILEKERRQGNHREMQKQYPYEVSYSHSKHSQLEVAQKMIANLIVPDSTTD